MLLLRYICTWKTHTYTHKWRGRPAEHNSARQSPCGGISKSRSDTLWAARASPCGLPCTARSPCGWWRKLCTLSACLCSSWSWPRSKCTCGTSCAVGRALWVGTGWQTVGCSLSRNCSAWQALPPTYLNFNAIPMWCCFVVTMWYRCYADVIARCDIDVILVWYQCAIDVIPMWYRCDIDAIPMWYRWDIDAMLMWYQGDADVIDRAFRPWASIICIHIEPKHSASKSWSNSWAKATAESTPVQHKHKEQAKLKEQLQQQLMRSKRMQQIWSQMWQRCAADVQGL